MSAVINEEFAIPEETVNWAKGAVSDLYASIQSFFDHNTARAITYFDPSTGDNVYKLEFTTNIPDDFRRKATEALNNARHSFDQSIFAARNIVSKRSGKGINYPWARDPVDLDSLLTRRGVPEVLRNTIRSHEPYGTSDSHAGGDDLIRTLAVIANGKHTVGLSISGTISEMALPNIRGAEVRSLTISRPFWDMRKNEIEVVRWQGDIQIEHNGSLYLAVCLQDSRLTQPVDIISALQHFAGKADLVCQTLKRDCLDFQR